MTGVLIKERMRGFDTQRYREDGHVKTDQKVEEERKGCPESLWRERGPVNTLGF